MSKGWVDEEDGEQKEQEDATLEQVVTKE